MTKTSKLVVDLGIACASGMKYAVDYDDLERAWFDCERSDWLLNVLNAIKYEDNKALRKFGCTCIRKTPFGDKVAWDFIHDIRTKSVVILAEKYIIGEATREDLIDAQLMAWTVPSGERHLESVIPMIGMFDIPLVSAMGYLSWKVSLLSGNLRRGLNYQAGLLREMVDFKDAYTVAKKYMEGK